MNNDWKDKDCIDCEFCVNNLCRRFPPTWIEPFHERSPAKYPNVESEYACFEFRSKIKK